MIENNIQLIFIIFEFTLYYTIVMCLGVVYKNNSYLKYGLIVGIFISIIFYFINILFTISLLFVMSTNNYLIKRKVYI